MNLGMETELIEFKKTTGELKEGILKRKFYSLWFIMSKYKIIRFEIKKRD